jgi:excisionase family DNA binding protein
MPDVQLLTVAEVCEKLGVTDRTFRRMVASKEFPEPIRRNRRWVRVPAQDLAGYLAKLKERRDARNA